MRDVRWGALSVLSLAVGAMLQLALAPAVYAQARPSPRLNSLYLEAMGNAGRASLNAERVLRPGLSLRVGYGVWNTASWQEPRMRSVPILVNVLRGRDDRQVELGAGVVLRGASDGHALTSTVGLRFTGPDGPLFRIGLTPSYSLRERRFFALAGASLGARF